MTYYLDRGQRLANDGLGKAWAWFDSLNTEEWFVLLGATAILGFMCLRGMGSRKSM